MSELIIAIEVRRANRALSEKKDPFGCGRAYHDRGNLRPVML